jgi:hypothetical protein
MQVMAPRLPPRDPHESPFAEPTGDAPFPYPTTIFSRGVPSPADERIADAILEARPGVLFVVLPG